ncbi:MAG: hypothetical protein M3Z92_00125 [Bacteroidota bacterium]|nr:hypothetical protein [Bacteroidota bacterium]
MKKYFGLFLLVVFFINLKSFSQSRDSLVQAYKNNTIYRYGNKFILGNEKLNYNDLRLQFNSLITQNLYKKSKNRLVISRIFNVASLGLIITSVLTKTDVNGAIKFAVGTGILGLGGLSYQTQSSKFLEKAIWERNEEVLFNSIH